MTTLYQSLLIALRALRVNKMRALLTMLGIIIGIAAVIAMMEIGNGSSKAIQKSIASMGADNFLVMPGAAASGGVSFGGGSATINIEPQAAHRLPSLQTLDVMNSRATTVGWIFLTIGCVIGAVWASHAHNSPDPRMQAMSLADPKILVAVLSWVIYSFALFARRAIGWAGRRAAYLSTIAFGVVLLNFVLVSYFLTKSHNF